MAEFTIAELAAMTLTHLVEDGDPQDAPDDATIIVTIAVTVDGELATKQTTRFGPLAKKDAADD